MGVVGDLLSVERAVNCLSSLASGFTPKERLDGMHIEIADWHAELKFLSVSQPMFCILSFILLIGLSVLINKCIIN